VEPAVVVAYHEALRRMLDDLLPSAHRKGALGQHIAELMSLHANGIAAIKAKGYTPPTHKHVEAPRTTENDFSTYDTTTQPTTQNRPVSVPQAEDPALAIWLTGAKNAHKNAEKKKQMVAAKKRKRKEVAA